MPSQRISFTASVAILCLLVTCLILLFPKDAFEASIRGVEIWWKVLFPALFPFFVISEMLLGFGIVHFFGTILDPMMRPLFRVPGIGGFVMAMGFASGYPVGARLTSQLWEQKLVNREEGERLIAFTTTSDPIFLIGAVAVGFYHDAGLAFILALSHYGAGMLVGLIMRFHGAKSNVDLTQKKTQGSILTRAFQSMHEARVKDGRTIGMLLQQAIQSSLQLIFVVGGLVVFFSVVLELFTLSHIMSLFYISIDSALHLAGIPAQLSEAVVNGFFEVTLGARSAGNAGEEISMIHKVAIGAFIISWSGLSVHAQVVSLLTRTNLRYRPFAIARLLHGIIAAALVYICWTPLQRLGWDIASVLPVSGPVHDSIPFHSAIVTIPALVFMISMAAIVMLYAVYFFIRIIFGSRRKA
jgi:sporulation integral membrane protein YlbJ